MKKAALSFTACLLLAAAGCVSTSPLGQSSSSFGDDVEFLKQHNEVLVLSDSDGMAKVAVVPAYQGRVMTSTANGNGGASFGWINRELIASGQLRPHINAFGGEDRLWMGPEGGQFSIFFKQGEAFDLEHWQTPAVIDADRYDLLLKTRNSAAFRRVADLVNYSGTRFKVQIDRTIYLLTRAEAADQLGGIEIPDDVQMVAFATENRITNIGQEAWKKETGLLSVWILGMFNPSPATTIVIPFKPGPEDQMGPKVNDAYFGKVPAERLVLRDDVLFFSGDGRCRGKIGLSPVRATPIAGSYDAAGKVLTVVRYNKPKNVTDYVNSMWEIQKNPYGGDAVNSYNDGPPSPGAKPLGPFYELETSSQAAALEPGKSLTHMHTTVHFQGSEPELSRIAQILFGVGTEDIAGALEARK